MYTCRCTLCMYNKVKEKKGVFEHCSSLSPAHPPLARPQTAVQSRLLSQQQLFTIPFSVGSDECQEKGIHIYIYVIFSPPSSSSASLLLLSCLCPTLPLIYLTSPLHVPLYIHVPSLFLQFHILHCHLSANPPLQDGLSIPLQQKTLRWPLSCSGTEKQRREPGRGTYM